MAQRSGWKTPLLIALGAVPFSVAGVLGGGWYYSDSLRKGALEPNREPSTLDIDVVAIGEGLVTLRATPSVQNDDWTTEGVFGLEWPGGYARVSGIVEIDGRQVVREFRPINGEPKPGDAARLDSFAFPTDPRKALGRTFQDVIFSSPLGDMAGRFMDGIGVPWATFGPGKRASLRE